jgi:hypothetical protein
MSRLPGGLLPEEWPKNSEAQETRCRGRENPAFFFPPQRTGHQGDILKFFNFNLPAAYPQDTITRRNIQ